MLAFDTDNGWYTVDVPAVTLFQKNHHYANSLSSFTRHDWVSPVLYVTFPADVTIVRTWVYSAAARNADTFGWDALGAVACPPPPDLAPDQRALYKGQQVRVMRDKAYQLENPDPLSAPPTSRSLILKAMPSKPLEHTNCAEPFREGEVRDQASPIYPAMLDGSAIGGMTSVEVAINPDGTLHDAWVWGPSGSSSLDNSALRAARQSTFKGARSYCMPVPSTYFFDVMFDPH
jgi:TonB family protein